MAGRTRRRWRLVRARREAVSPAQRRWHRASGANAGILGRFRRSAVSGRSPLEPGGRHSRRGPIGRRSRLGPVGRHSRLDPVGRRSRLGPVGRRRLALAAAGLALVAGCAWVVFGTSTLAVREVRVTGSAIASPAQVRAIAGVLTGTPLARIDTGAVERRVRTLASVAAVDVHRSWPSTLVIAVTERVPAAAVHVGRQFLVVDATGVVFDHRAARPSGVALLRVPAPGPDDAATLAGLRVLASLTTALRGQLAELVVASPAAIQLDLADGRTVVWGDAEQSDLKARVATALLSRVSTRIDVSAPEVVAVR